MTQAFQSFTITVRHETPGDEAAIEALSAMTFGPGRFARAAFRLREGVESDRRLSFVAMENGDLAGSVKLTPIRIGGRPALVLGPLVVDPRQRGKGVGRELMNRCLHEASCNGHDFVILVGDEAYYGPFGFERVKPGSIRLPGPADPMRILGCELVPGAARHYSGVADRHFPGECVQGR